MTTYQYRCSACRHRSAMFSSAATRDTAAAKHARGCRKAVITDGAGRVIHPKR
jgi:predicted nucleic acid-binding Zn ribbon protein